MQHVKISRPADSQTLAPSIYTSLEGMVAGIDAKFMAAGTALAKMIEAVDCVMRGLDDVSNAFEGAQGKSAIDGLAIVARRLANVPAIQDQRSDRHGDIRDISRRLRAFVADVGKALEVLQIYSVNVKIAASGMEDFVNFADKMQRQLFEGEKLVSGFEFKLLELETSLDTVDQSSSRLKAECAKVVPAIPERLINDAQQLKVQQAAISGLAANVRIAAQSIQADAAAVLGAIQIGDITRQRLEHVLLGCHLLEENMSALPVSEVEITRRLFLSLLSAQLLDTAEDFEREVNQLIHSLDRVAPQTQGLLTLREGNCSVGDSRLSLVRIETGVAEADAMTRQLREADAQAETLAHVILATVDDLVGRARGVKNLRLDVQHMAINIGLRCRRVEAIGRPVAVIANEIRSYSEKLDATMFSIDNATTELMGVSIDLGRSLEEEGASNEDLATSVAIIGEGARLSEKALQEADEQANQIVAVLKETGDQLKDGLVLSCEIRTLGDLLAGLVDGPAEWPESGAGPTRELIDRLGHSYTMARERQIHALFCGSPAPDLPTSPAEEPPMDQSDDDVFFD